MGDEGATKKPTNASLKQTNGSGIRWSETFACRAKRRRPGSRSLFHSILSVVDK